MGKYDPTSATQNLDTLKGKKAFTGIQPHVIFPKR